MYNRRSIRLETRPCVLESSVSEDYTVRPSASIYYGKYPYKITFDDQIVNKSIPEGTDFRLFDHELYFEFRDFAKNFNNFYKLILQGKRRIYISDYQDFTSTLGMYGDWVSEVQGPVSDDHIDMIYTTDLDLVVKTSPYYNKYEYKLEIFASYYAIRNLWLSTTAIGNGVPTATHQWKTQMKEDLENFIETLKAQNFNTKISYGSYGSYHNAVIFFTQNDYNDILTFKKLIVPDFRTRITKVII
jgi:hypothetical protein